jgi:hydroxymethylglutaryl-CoA lyase
MDEVRIVEVGPRDGLQNEAVPVPIDVKLRFIQGLTEAGLSEIEATSFVSPKWVPQLADAAELWPNLPLGPRYSAFIPNLKGLERAMQLGVTRIALFTAASESFARANVNMSLSETLDQISACADLFRGAGVARGWIRAYVSTAFECPFEGKVLPGSVIGICESLLKIGVDEISLGDTIGVASPKEVQNLGNEILSVFGERHRTTFAWHFHDTWGTGLANVSAALGLGFRTFDASAGGLGGCPYAPGAGGNLATEDLIYLLERSGVRTGVDLERLAQASQEILALVGKQPTARAQVAALARCAAGSGPT